MRKTSTHNGIKNAADFFEVALQGTGAAWTLSSSVEPFERDDEEEGSTCTMGT